MHIHKIFLAIFFFSALSLAQENQLTRSETVHFKENVAKKAQDLQSLTSDFTQTKHIQLMQHEAVSTGKLYYKTPNVLKWEYQTPYNYLIIFRENQLFINDEGDKSVTNLQSNKLFEKLVALISGSVNGKLLADPENFEVSYLKEGNKVSAVIIPLDASLKQMFSEIILNFDKNHLINSVKLLEESGDYTKIIFRNIQLNPHLDESVFRN